MDQAELDIVVGIFRMIPLSYNAVMKINDEITDCWSKRIFYSATYHRSKPIAEITIDTIDRNNILIKLNNSIAIDGSRVTIYGSCYVKHFDLSDPMSFQNIIKFICVDSISFINTLNHWVDVSEQREC